jgi:hypothetical protein
MQSLTVALQGFRGTGAPWRERNASLYENLGAEPPVGSRGKAYISRIDITLNMGSEQSRVVTCPLCPGFYTGIRNWRVLEIVGGCCERSEQKMFVTPPTGSVFLPLNTLPGKVGRTLSIGVTGPVGCELKF